MSGLSNLLSIQQYKVQYHAKLGVCIIIHTMTVFGATRYSALFRLSTVVHYPVVVELLLYSTSHVQCHNSGLLLNERRT